MVGDIAKAHRRFKHREEEHGYLGCQIDNVEEIEGDPDSQMVDKDLGRRDKGNPPPARTRVHAGPATLRRRPGVTWSWSLGKKGDTAR